MIADMSMLYPAFVIGALWTFGAHSNPMFSVHLALLAHSQLPGVWMVIGNHLDAVYHVASVGAIEMAPKFRQTWANVN